MDFHFVTKNVLTEFERLEVTYAAIGGFALGFWGVTRSTIDMDFLLLLDDAELAAETLANFGYRQTHASENVGQFVHDDSRYGTLDFIYAFRDISRKMLDRAVRITIIEDIAIRCLLPEDIIGLKLQALVNDPSRKYGDLADIHALVAARHAQGQPVDWHLLEEYFDLFDQGALLTELRHNHE